VILGTLARAALRSPAVVYPAVLVLGLALLAGGWLALGGAAGGGGGSAERYVEGVIGAPARVNPLLAGRNQPDDDLAVLVFSGLTRIAGDGTPLPDLAERWEVTPDGRTYTFQLRGDVFWHDGERLDAADVAFTVGLVQAPGFAGSEALAAAWAPVEVIVADGDTILFRLPEPSAPFLTVAALGVLPEHLLGGVEGIEGRALLDAGFNRAPVGTGPYRLVELDRARARLERNTSYYLGAPAIDEIELRFYPDTGALAAAIARSEVDGALLPPEIVSLGGADHRAHALTEAGYLALYINNQRTPLDEPVLRHALAAAIDRDALAAAADALPGEGPIVPGSWAHAPPAPRALDTAGALLDGAGWPRNEFGRRARDGVELDLQLATNDDPRRATRAAALAAQLRAHGVRVSIEVLPASELLATRLEPRDYDLLLFGWQQGADPDPYPAWHTSQIVPGGRNVAGYTDPASDRLLEAARATLDVAERRELYALFTERFAETAPAVVVLYPRRSYLLPADLEVPDPGLLFGPESRFRDVHLWRFAP
jgi:peptide/nickel transport system substrate-binding protein